MDFWKLCSIWTNGFWPKMVVLKKTDVWKVLEPVLSFISFTSDDAIITIETCRPSTWRKVSLKIWHGELIPSLVKRAVFSVWENNVGSGLRFETFGLFCCNFWVPKWRKIEISGFLQLFLENRFIWQGKKIECRYRALIYISAPLSMKASIAYQSAYYIEKIVSGYSGPRCCQLGSR